MEQVAQVARRTLSQMRAHFAFAKWEQIWKDFAKVPSRKCEIISHLRDQNRSGRKIKVSFRKCEIPSQMRKLPLSECINRSLARIVKSSRDLLAIFFHL